MVTPDKCDGDNNMACMDCVSARPADLLYLQAVGALQVPQSPLHQVGQVLVDGLVADVVQVVVAADTHTHTRGQDINNPAVRLRRDPEFGSGTVTSWLR